MNNDLISRSALKEELEKCFFIDGYYADKFEKLIDNAPTVEIRDNFDIGYVQGLEDGQKRPQGEWSLVEHKKNIDLVCPCCGYHRCNLAYGFSIEEVREQIKEDKSNDYLLPDFCERCGAKLGFGGNKE